MRIGLVLGGGAVQGSVWMEGALAALAEETGWFPGDAEVVVGTSAGSWIGTLLGAGVPPWLLAAQSSGDAIDGLIPGTAAPVPDAPSVLTRIARVRVGSPGLLLRSIVPPKPLRWWMGALPRGVRDSGVEALVRRVVPSGWPERTDLRCVAVDYARGRRVVFGRDTGGVDAAEAVAASCAVPFVFRPQRIEGRDYVDGGLHSVSNLDVLAGAGLDLVICLNPISSLDAVRARDPWDVAWGLIRGATGPRLGREARRVREAGTPVLLLQPRRRDIEVLGKRWLRPHRLPEVIAEARESVRAQLAESAHGELLGRLPAGDAHLVRRPDGVPAAWPPLVSPPAYVPTR